MRLREKIALPLPLEDGPSCGGRPRAWGRVTERARGTGSAREPDTEPERQREEGEEKGERHKSRQICLEEGREERAREEEDKGTETDSEVTERKKAEERGCESLGDRHTR